MAQMAQETKAFLKELVSELRATPREDELAHKRAMAKNLARLKAMKEATFKSKRFAYYIVGREGSYFQGKMYEPGEVIKIPLAAPYDGLPSKTFMPASEESIAAAENEARFNKAKEGAEAIAAADDDALDPDELAADRAAGATSDDEEPEADEDEEPAEEDDVHAAPTPPAKSAKSKAGKPAPKKGKAGKGRASDQDVA